MDSRERIMIALSHREPDRVPYDLGELWVPAGGGHCSNNSVERDGHLRTDTRKAQERISFLTIFFFEIKSFIDARLKEKEGD